MVNLNVNYLVCIFFFLISGTWLRGMFLYMKMEQQKYAMYCNYLEQPTMIQSESFWITHAWTQSQLDADGK